MRWRSLLGFALVTGLLSGCGSSDSSKQCGCKAGETCFGGACLAAAADCVLPPVRAASAQAPAVVSELASGEAPAAVGETLTFEVPPGTQSISITEQAVTMAVPAVSVRYSGQDEFATYNSAALLALRDPSGAVIFDDRAGGGDPEQQLVYFGTSSPGTGTITIPGTSAALELARAGLPAGTWTLVVSDYAYECSLDPSPCTSGASTAGRYGVTVVTRPGPAGGFSAAGTLDVTFYVVTSSIDPATATSDPAVARMQATYAAYLSRAGIALGNVEYVAADPALVQRFATGLHGDDLGACGDLAQLLSSSRPDSRAMNVFLVPFIVVTDDGSYGRTVGLDGSIPAPSTVSGTVWSGIVVSVENLRKQGFPNACAGDPSPTSCGPDSVGYVAAHETGHALGLYHTTESTGTYFDPLTDTARCPCQSCASQPGECADAPSPPSTPYSMKVTDCLGGPSSSCGGGENLMFWLIDLGSSGQLTVEQGEVMRTNPYVY